MQIQRVKCLLDEKTNMAGFFRNVRGLNKLLKHSTIKYWVRSNSMEFCCVLETRVKEGKAVRILDSVFRGWSAMTNYEHSQGGRIWLVWKETVCMTPVFKSDQLITCSVRLQNGVEFFRTFIYASNIAEERKVLWRNLCDHNSSQMFTNKAWVLMGDFNEILDGEESSGL